jgi:prepilin-type N-terminal cleavage/methylation domain-containing protein/prepilin-type processing-associated H-X9-DG protein
MRDRWHEATRRRGFTLVELLVAVAIIGILAGLLATAIAKAKGKAHSLTCLSNARQLTLAWTLYATEYNDRLPYNLGGSASSRGIAPKLDYNWVNNIMTWGTNQDNTNLAFVSKGSFAPFANRAARIYRCPSDRVLSDLQRQAGWSERVRSYSMNAMVGDAGENSKYGTNIFNPDYKQFMKMSDIGIPTEIFVFVDEHPDSINDGGFAVAMPATLAATHVVDFPASYHNGAGGISFMDGHAEIKKWLDPRTTMAIRKGRNLDLMIASPNNRDVAWLQERAAQFPRKAELRLTDASHNYAAVAVLGVFLGRRLD